MSPHRIVILALALVAAGDLQAQERTGPGKPALTWILDRTGEASATADPARRLQVRADHAAAQVRVALSIDPKESSAPRRFANGAAALLHSSAATYDPDSLLAAARKVEEEAIAATVAAYLARRFRSQGRSLDDVASTERVDVVRRFVADQGFAAAPDPDAARFLQAIQDDLRGDGLPEPRARAIFDRARAFAAEPAQPERISPGEVAAELGAVKSALAKQNAALAGGLAESLARIGNGDPAAVAAAAGAIDAAAVSARNVTPDLLKSIDALERLGVIRPVSAELLTGVQRLDTAISIVQGGIAISMANPTGVVQLLEGLAELVGKPKGKKSGDARTEFLTRLGARLDDVAIVLEDSYRKLDRLQESLARVRVDVALSMERQEREIARLRQAMTTLVASVSFQDFESCVLVEDVLRKSRRLQVSTATSGALTFQIGADWREQLRLLRAEPSDDRSRPPVLMQECTRSLLRLFGTDQAASVSRPFSIAPGRDGDGPDAAAADRHAMLLRALSAELRAGSAGTVAPQGLMRYVAMAPWLERPAEAARLWARVAEGESGKASEPMVEPEATLRRDRIDADRLRIVARVALYLAPMFWLETASPAPKPGAPMPEHPGVRVLTNLAALLDQSLSDEAVTNGLVAVPAAMALHGRLVADYLRRFDEVAAQRRTLEGMQAGSDARAAAAAELERHEQSLAGARAALLELEAELGATEAFRRQTIEYEMHRSIAASDGLHRAGLGPARRHLAEEWRVGLAGAAVARGSRRWIDGAGRQRDVYAELLRASSFAWQIERPDARDHLYDPAACRADDGSEAPWIARSNHRRALHVLCGRLATATDRAFPVLFSGHSVAIPALSADEPVAGERLEDLRRLASEARMILALARAQVIEDGSDRPIVVAGR